MKKVLNSAWSAHGGSIITLGKSDQSILSSILKLYKGLCLF